MRRTEVETTPTVASARGPHHHTPQTGNQAGNLAGKLAALFVLYFIQGLPFGFQAMALPVYLREWGASLTAIGFLGVLALPWMLKVLWAPVVDAWYWPRFGPRRSWIVPMQAGLALACCGAALVEPETQLWALLGLVLCMNAFAATMDVAVDGFAVDVLAARHLGYGNITQVVGYKVGMLTGGGVLLTLADSLGWSGMFAIMAALVFAAMILTLFIREPVRQSTAGTVRGVLGALYRALRTPGTGWLLVFIATYKMGETMADTLFRPFLVDSGFTRAQIGAWVNTYGILASMLGAAVGGILASRIGFLRAVGIAACLRILPIAGEWWLTLTTPTAAAVIGVTMAEQFLGSVLTTAMFAFMMSQVDRRIGATHYTLFATVEVVGKGQIAPVAGIVADATSYPVAFGGAVLLSIAFLALFIPIWRRQQPR